MSLAEYILLAASSLFVIVDPFATVPAFLAMTPTDTPRQRVRMARLSACLHSAVSRPRIAHPSFGMWR